MTESRKETETWRDDLDILKNYYDHYGSVAGALPISVSGSYLRQVAAGRYEPSARLKEAIRVHANGTDRTSRQA